MIYLSIDYTFSDKPYASLAVGNQLQRDINNNELWAGCGFVDDEFICSGQPIDSSSLAETIPSTTTAAHMDDARADTAECYCYVYR